jgi:hypothetical protein
VSGLGCCRESAPSPYPLPQGGEGKNGNGALTINPKNGNGANGSYGRFD